MTDLRHAVSRYADLRSGMVDDVAHTPDDAEDMVGARFGWANATAARSLCGDPARVYDLADA